VSLASVADTDVDSCRTLEIAFIEFLVAGKGPVLAPEYGRGGRTSATRCRPSARRPSLASKEAVDVSAGVRHQARASENALQHACLPT
jgi:hypothetical protein